MFKNYFIVALRSLSREKSFAFIKIFGLVLGLAASFVIYLYVLEDLSYDKFNRNYDHIARILSIDNADGVSSKLVGVTPPAMGPVIAAELPEIVKSVRVSGGGRLDLTYGDNMLRCDAGFRTESSFFDVFDYPILKGKKEGVLDQPNDIVITESLAHRLFGEEDPVGKTVKFNQNTDFHVVALVADPPKLSHLQFDLLRSMTPAQGEDGFRQFLESWQGLGMFTYVLLDKPLDAETLNSKIQALLTKNNPKAFFSASSQPLSSIHLDSRSILFETNANKSDRLNTYILSVIALLILVLASVNFINMVTAKSTTRAKEVGLRKVAGAVRSQLVMQHLVESLLITSAAAVIALAVAFAIMPWLNTLYGRFADFMMLLTWQNISMVILLVAALGFIAGLYPALVLSSFQPVLVLKGAFKNSDRGIQLRKALVVVQFTISIALIVGTGIVYQQMDYIFNADLGYKRDEVITLNQNGQNVANATLLKNELLKNPMIRSVGTASNRIGQQLGRSLIYPEGFPDDSNIITSSMAVDENFIPTMEMSMRAGRNFSLQFADSSSIIVNEELTRLLKWDDAVGKKIKFGNGSAPGPNPVFTVVGVVKDFHFATIRHKLEPLFLTYNANNGSMAVKIAAGKFEEAIPFIESTWKRINPGSIFEYAFLDDQFANLYRNEKAFTNMFSHFTFLAMVIAALGLFTLSAFTAEMRKKEIGIRKVLGASNTSILINLSAEFILLIGISFVAASTISYFAMRSWLADFQYSIQIGAGIFVAAGAVSLLIALVSISVQAMKAALRNPVNALRSE